jgi:putative FmdB family regulatory protein
MPLYDFRCAECRAEREVRASLAEADSLELVCVSCGGTMRRTLTKATGVIIAVSPSPSARPPSATAGGGARRGARHRHGAVRLTQPNPFAGSLPPRPDAEKSK